MRSYRGADVKTTRKLSKGKIKRKLSMQNRKFQIKKPDLQKLISGEKILEFCVQIDMLRLQSIAESLEVRSHFKDAYITIALEVLGAQPCNRKDHTTLQKTKDHLEERHPVKELFPAALNRAKYRRTGCQGGWGYMGIGSGIQTSACCQCQ